MWTRAQIKTNAKAVMARNYWQMLGVSVVYVLIGGAINSSTISSSRLTLEFSENMSVQAMVMALIALLVALAFTFAFNAFVACPLEVGKNRYFMKNRLMPARFNDLFFAFGDARLYYMNVVKTQFLRILYEFLWSLLLVIPGIIKGYEYRMIPYILAENPSIDPKRAFALSKKMTDGEKWKMFVLDLSFYGWLLLGSLACCVGIYFVEPYIQATYAELYEAMRAKMYDMGETNEYELCNFYN